MAAKNWFAGIRTIDIRLIAAAGAALLLIGAVMWTIPTTPDSNSFTFDQPRRDFSSARPLEINKPVQGRIVDGSDADYYRFRSGSGGRVQIHVRNDSGTLIPALDIYDTTKKLIDEKLGAGDSLLAQANTIYYIQISGQRSTTGPYTLIVNDSADSQ